MGITWENVPGGRDRLRYYGGRLKMTYELYEKYDLEEKTVEVDTYGGMNKAVLTEAVYRDDEDNEKILWEVEEYHVPDFLKRFRGNKRMLYFKMRQTQMDLYDPVTVQFESEEAAREYFYNDVPTVNWRDFANELLADELQSWATEDMEEAEKDFWEMVETADHTPINI